MTGVEDITRELVACTTATKNYLSHVRVLTSSFLRFHPKSKVFVLLADEVDGYFDPDKESFSLVRLKDLGISDLQQLEFKYNPIELCCALKPFVLEYLMKRGLRKIVYLDNDILVTDKFRETPGLLDRYSVVLTPHLLEPIGTVVNPSELDILVAGTYNLGFLAIANTKNAMSFVQWWKSRIHDYCVWEPSKGMFGDQRWVELGLGYFEGFYILRDPGYNLAFWNMGARKLQTNHGKYFVNGKPLRFVHFSGFEPDHPETISRYQNRYRFRDLPEYEPLFSTYVDLLFSFGYHTTRHWPWAFDYYDSGIRIPPRARQIYRDSQELQRRYPNPFLTNSEDSYYRWLRSSMMHERLKALLRGLRLLGRDGLEKLIYNLEAQR